jgi:hypothetical protein
MEEEPANELLGAARHVLVSILFLGPLVLPLERGALFIQRNEPAVSPVLRASPPPRSAGPVVKARSACKPRRSPYTVL